MTQRSSIPAVPGHRPALLRLIALLVVVSVTGTGCGKVFKRDKQDENEGVPVEQLYEEANASMQNGNWSGAETKFRRLIAQYPYGTHTEQALIETAYAQYKSGRHDEAVSSIDRFIRTYPTHHNIPYLYYLRGLVNSGRDTVFLQRVWSLDASRRDLSTPMQAFSDFRIVAENYPDSRYAEDARQRMVALRNMLARHELDTAFYYLRRDAWVAAANRARYLLETYPQSEYQNDAIAVLGVAYTELGNQALADDSRRVLQLNEPGHPWLAGKWPDYPSHIRKLNPFAPERSAIDVNRK